MSTPESPGSLGTPNPASVSTKSGPSVWEIFYPRRIEGHRNVIFLASFPEIIFFWPSVLICFFCAFAQAVGLLGPVGCGWLFTIIVLYNFLVLVQDFDQKQFAIVCLAFLAMLLLVWIASLYGIGFFSAFFGWFASFEPSLSTDTYVIFGVLLLGFFIWGCISPLFSYWMLSQNEFIHYTQPVGRDLSIARIGCTISKEIPDVLECILTFGGGTLVIKKDNQVLASIRNVPFLGQRMDAIEHMLAETRVTVSTEQ